MGKWAKMEPGGLGQLFRLLLGSRRGAEGPSQQPDRDHGHEQWSHQNERPPRDEADLYKVFTNPLEMNRFFEEQMDEMLRNFEVRTTRALGRPPSTSPSSTS